MSELSFEREVLDRLIAIEGKLDGYNNAKAKTYENEKDIIQLKDDVQDAEKRISDLEDANKWLARTIAATIITIVVGAVVFAIRMGAGV